MTDLTDLLEPTPDREPDRERRPIGARVAAAVVLAGVIAFAFFLLSALGPSSDAPNSASYAHTLILGRGHMYTDGTQDGSQGTVRCSGIPLPDLRQIGVAGSLQAGYSQFAEADVSNLLAHVQTTRPGHPVFADAVEYQRVSTHPDEIGYTRIWAQAEPGCLIAYASFSGYG